MIHPRSQEPSDFLGHMLQTAYIVLLYIERVNNIYYLCCYIKLDFM